MNLKLLPSDNFTICTGDSISVVRQKLIEHVENSKMIRSIENRDFRGIISEYIFKICPVYKSNFHAPIIIGKFESIQNETLIHLQITLRFHQYIFFGLNFLLLLLTFKSLIESYLHQGSTLNSFQILYWINIIFISIITGLNLRFYLAESRFAKAKLKQIFLS
jgi:hypothetical protein